MSVVIDLVVPDGKTNGVIKNVFSYAIVLVVVMPLPKLLKVDNDFERLFSQVDFTIQDDYIYNINQSKLDKWTECITSDLESDGINGVVVSISANIFERNMQINAVYVDLYNVVISDKNKNINIKTEVVCVVLNYLDIDRDKVVFYEWQKGKTICLGKNSIFAKT